MKVFKIILGIIFFLALAFTTLATIWAFNNGMASIFNYIVKEEGFFKAVEFFFKTLFGMKI